MVRYARSRRTRIALLWIGVALALFSGLTMLLASRYGGLTGEGGGAVFAAIAAAGVVGVVLVALSLRRPSDLASTSQTGRLLDRLQSDPGLLRAAEGAGSAEGLRRIVVDAIG